MASRGNVNENGFDPSDSSDLDSDDESAGCEWDLALIHERNRDLRLRGTVNEFFAKVSTIESLWDGETREWLSTLPFYMSREAIPLFEHSSDGVAEDYQLHPSYTWLPIGRTANDPDIDLFAFEQADPECLFIPLGRLFVNAENGSLYNERCSTTRSRLTRWTGHEVFVGTDMALWIAFDGDSLASHASPWYPVSCSITKRLQPNHGLTKLLPSFRGLQKATFKDAERTIMTSGCAIDNPRLLDMEKSEVREREALFREEYRLTQSAGGEVRWPLTRAIARGDVVEVYRGLATRRFQPDLRTCHCIIFMILVYLICHLQVSCNLSNLF